MTRSPFNVLVLPYRWHESDYQFAVLHRADGTMWQFIAGGGEDGEAPLAAARREAHEEAGIDALSDNDWMVLDSVASIPRTAFPGVEWPQDVYVIPEICFGVIVRNRELQLSREHDGMQWLDYERARATLTWDSNRVALWELRERLKKLRDPPLQPTGFASG